MNFARDKFVSYSANYEDVYIKRIFENQPLGFYVDIGAAHPLFENDTKALYERGWVGINVEPNPEFFETLASERSRDRNLQLLVSKKTGKQSFYKVTGTGLSTADSDEASRARDKGFEVIEIQVVSDTLSNILEQSAPTAIDLLKVDVEGYELNVLESNDWSKFRPKLILVEATIPETATRRPDKITPYLMEVGYRRVFFDGLNDYYLEQNFSLPEEIFDRPVNVFDNFIPLAQFQLSDACEYLKGLRDSLEAKVASMESQLASLESYLVLSDEQSAALRVSLQEQNFAMEAAMRQQAVHVRQLREHTHIIEAQASDFLRLKTEAKAANGRASSFSKQLDAALLEADRIFFENKRGFVEKEQLITSLQAEKSSLQTEVQNLVGHRAEARLIRQSTSWRITRPLRAIRRPRRTLMILLGMRK